MDTIELKKGKKWQLTQTEKLSGLTIAEGAAITVPEGKTLTLTVDGVEKELAPGQFKGNVVLTVCDGFGRAGGFGPPGQVDKTFRGALYIGKDGVDKAKSVEAALLGGSYDGNSLSGVKIVSDGPLFGGVSVDGAKYKIKDLDIKMNGYGGNDFTGIGAGFAASGDADVEIENMKIRSDGVIRVGSIVTDKAKAHFKNCDILCTGGTLSQQEEAEKATASMGSMCKVPWQLGTIGNCRATSVLTKGTAFYENCVIRSNSWGVLSTDGTASPKSLDQYSIHLDAKNCLVENLTDNGYGAFSIGACKECFEGCTFNVGTYALIQANETACAAFDGCKVNSKHFGTMTYCNQGGAIEVKNSEFNTKFATFLVKGGYPEIVCENSKLSSENGVILQLMDCDDPMYGCYGELFDAPTREKVAGHDLTKENRHDITIFGIKSENHCTDLRASFKDMTINGNFYNSVAGNCTISGGFNMPDPDDMPDFGSLPAGMDMAGAGGPPADMPAPDMGMGSPDPNAGGFSMPKMKPASDYPINLCLSFKNTTVTGVISATIGKHAYEKSAQEHWREMGVVTNTPAPALNNGVVVTLDSASVWNVTGESYISALTIEKGAKVNAASMTVNGVATEIAPGTYKGEIVVK